MKAIRSVKNQYRGVNAHLHSFVLKEGGWSELHTSLIVQLTGSLRAELLPLGYVVGMEQSVQIRRTDESEQRWQSDVTIFDPHPIRQRFEPSPLATAEMVLPNIETLYDDTIAEAPYRAISIRNINRSQDDAPIVWIEVLSPSNKPGGQDYLAYITKRYDLLDNDVIFIELDFLHESSATIRGIASYRTRKNQAAEAGSHPYRVLMIEPRPTTQKGKTHIYEFDVDHPIPTIAIPLSGEDTFKFNFDIPYQKMLYETLLALERVDYSQLPLNFDRYSRADQTRIVRRMVAVIEAVKNGIDLETAPFEVEALTLEEGLARLEALQKISE